MKATVLCLIIALFTSCRKSEQSGSCMRINNGVGKTKVNAFGPVVIQSFTNTTGRAWTLDTVCPHAAFTASQAAIRVEVVDGLGSTANVLASDVRSGFVWGYASWRRLRPVNHLGNRLSVGTGATVYLKFTSPGDSLLLTKSNDDRFGGTLYINGVPQGGDLKLRVTSTESF